MVFHQRAGCLQLRWKQSFQLPTKDLSTLPKRPPRVRPTVVTHEGVQGSFTVKQGRVTSIVDLLRKISGKRGSFSWHA